MRILHDEIRRLKNIVIKGKTHVLNGSVILFEISAVSTKYG